jgi:hypothetical protein
MNGHEQVYLTNGDGCDLSMRTRQKVTMVCFLLLAKVKVPGHTMKLHGGAEVKLYPFLNSTLDYGE